MMTSNKTDKNARAFASSEVIPATRLRHHDSNRAHPLIDLPGSIKSVYASIDIYGEENDGIVIDAVDRKGRQFFFLLALTSLAKGQYDDLASFAVKANLHEYGCAGKKLQSLGAALLQSIGKQIYLARREGLHSVELDGAKYHFYVHRGAMFHFGKKPPFKIGVTLDDDQLPPASGNLNEWQENVGAHLVGNPELLAVVLAALSSPLIRVFNLPPLILALVGQSSSGKTTAQQIAKSLYEPAGSIENCSGTANGIRAHLEQYADRPAFLDELHLAEDVDGLINLIFQIGNGARRKTSTANQKSSLSYAMTCGLITASEMTLDEIAASKRVTLTEGLSARYIELVVGGEMGIFRTVPDGITPKQFSDTLKGNCEIYGGAFWDAWIEGISENFDHLKKWVAETLPLVEVRLSDGLNITDRVTLRMVRGLAVWACAGLIAKKLKFLDLNSEEIIGAVRLVLSKHLARQRHKMTPIAEKVIDQVRGLIDRNRLRFPPLVMFHREESNGVMGYTKGHGTEKLYLILPTVFDAQIGSKFGTQMAAQKLLDAGYLSVDADGMQRQFRLPKMDEGLGFRKRFYAVKAVICFDIPAGNSQ